jgi:hypothetical protein
MNFKTDSISLCNLAKNKGIIVIINKKNKYVKEELSNAKISIATEKINFVLGSKL